MKYFYLILLFVWILPLGQLAAETPATMAQEAQKAYEGRDYAQAIQKWEELRSVGYTNGNLFQNLGNAAWQMGQGGRARWYFLQGLKLDPRNEALRNNLQFTEEKLGLAKHEIMEGPLGVLQGLPWWKLSLNFFESLRAAGILSLLFFGILLFKKWKGTRASKWIVWGVGIPWAILVFFVVWQGQKLYFNREAVVLSAGVDLLSAPATEATTGQNLPEGSIVHILKKQGDFRLVKTPQRNSAWVESSHLGPLVL